MSSIAIPVSHRRVSQGSGLARVLVTLGVVVFVARGLERVLHPVLWAEDGSQFFSQPISSGGLESIVTPFAGYLHVVPRLVALAISPLPYAFAPALYAIAAVVMTLAIFSVVLSPRLTWLLPTPRSRATAFVLLCASPVLSEAYGNIANLIFIGGIGLFLLGMSDDPISRPARAGELVLVGVLALSGPVVVLLLPVIVYRWWRVGRSHHSAAVAGIAIAGALVQTIIYSSSSRTTPGGGSIEIAARSVVERVAGGWLFGFNSLFDPGGGPLQTTALATVWILAALAVTVLVLRSEAIAAWISLLALTGAAAFAYGDIFVSGALAGQRHVMTPVAILIVLLVAAAARSAARRTRFVAIACLVLGFYGVLAALPLRAHPGSSDMSGLQDCRETGAALCSTPIAPAGWGVYLVR